MMNVPQWYIDLHYEGCPEDEVQRSYNEYRDYKEEGYSKHYILVCVQGLADPAY